MWTYRFYFLLLAALMLVAKPFIGFHVLKQVNEISHPTILAKSFNKRKWDYIENSEFDTIGT